MALNAPTAYDEFVEMLVDKVTPQEIIAFKASPEAQARSRELIEKNNAGTLTDEEKTEVERILQFERLFSVLKARALKSLHPQQ